MKKALVACLAAVIVLPLLAVAATVPALPKGYTGWQKSERN